MGGLINVARIKRRELATAILEKANAQEPIELSETDLCSRIACE